MIIFFEMEDVAVFVEDVERGQFGADQLRDFINADVGNAFNVQAIDFFGQRSDDIQTAA